MSSDDEPGWIVIPNWEKFQHYKDRDPPWIKNYTRLLRKDEYLDLSVTQRAALHGIWLIAAENHNNGKVPHNTSKLSRKLNVKVTKRTLEALNHAGFIEFSASKTLSPEKENRERKTFLPSNGN